MQDDLSIKAIQTVLDKLPVAQQDRKLRFKSSAYTQLSSTYQSQRHTTIQVTSVALCTMPVAFIMLLFLSSLHLLVCQTYLHCMKSLAFLSVVTFGEQPAWRDDVTGYCLLPRPSPLCKNTADKLTWYCEVLLVGWSIKKRQHCDVKEISPTGAETPPLTLSIPAVYLAIHQYPDSSGPSKQSELLCIVL